MSSTELCTGHQYKGWHPTATIFPQGVTLCKQRENVMKIPKRSHIAA